MALPTMDVIQLPLVALQVQMGLEQRWLDSQGKEMGQKRRHLADLIPRGSPSMNLRLKSQFSVVIISTGSKSGDLVQNRVSAIQ